MQTAYVMLGGVTDPRGKAVSEQVGQIIVGVAVGLFMASMLVHYMFYHTKWGLARLSRRLEGLPDEAAATETEKWAKTAALTRSLAIAAASCVLAVIAVLLSSGALLVPWAVGLTIMLLLLVPMNRFSCTLYRRVAQRLPPPA
jgi:hypothetical protein